MHFITAKAYFFRAVSSVFTVLFGWSEEDERFGVDLEAAMELHRQGAVFIDVRRPFEWRSGAVKRALHATNADLSKVSPLPEKSQTIVTYCEAGDRARKSARRLRKMGFEQVYFIWPGGFSTWSHAGLPVSRVGA